MREQACIAFLDVRELYNDDGSLKPLSEMSDEARAAIQSIDIEKKVSAGNEREVFILKKVKLHSKSAALESIGRALGAYEKDNRQIGDIIPAIVNASDLVG